MKYELNECSVMRIHWESICVSPFLCEDLNFSVDNNVPSMPSEYMSIYVQIACLIKQMNGK